MTAAAAMARLERTVARFDAWFHAEVADRPPVTFLYLWKGGGKEIPAKTHGSRREFSLDAEYHLDCFEAGLDNWAFIGDTMPCFKHELGSDQMAALFGGQLKFNEASSWSEHFLYDIRDVLPMHPNLACDEWQTLRRSLDYSVASSQGRWLTGMNLCDTSADLLVALRGPEQLCYDLCDDPQGVHLAVEHVASFFPMLYDDLRARIAVSALPTSIEGEVRFGRVYRPGCDFLCMVSSEMAAQTFFPALWQQLDWLEHSYFHVDSIGWLKHLDLLLTHPKLGGIQWVYGVNNGPASRWIDVYQRIQTAGKAMEVLPYDVADALEVMRHLRPEGVWFKFFGGVSIEDAEYLTRAVAQRENWAR